MLFMAINQEVCRVMGLLIKDKRSVGKRFESYVNFTKEEKLGILVGCERKKTLSYIFNG